MTQEKKRIAIGNAIIIAIGLLLIFLAIDARGQGQIYRQDIISADKGGAVRGSIPTGGTLEMIGLMDGFAILSDDGKVVFKNIFWDKHDAVIWGSKNVRVGYTQTNDIYRRIYIRWSSESTPKWFAYSYFGSGSWIKNYYK